MEEIIHVENQYYILATASRMDDRCQVLKHGETFAVFDHYGNVVPLGMGEQGIFHEGTRFLSRLELRLNDSRPLLLSSTVRDDNDILQIDLTNQDVSVDGEVVLPRGTVHLFRSKFLWNGACYERIQVSNHGLSALSLKLAVRFEADFRDIFEVRGIRREVRGEGLPAVVGEGMVVLGYRGLDGVERRTRLHFEPEPQELTASFARFELTVEPRRTEDVVVIVACEVGEEPKPTRRERPPAMPYAEALQLTTTGILELKGELSKVASSNDQFNTWVDRSVADTHMMVTQMPTGPYPFAGVPWFSTAFGRDGIITALELLWVTPSIARGVLAYLAETQATDFDPLRDAEPGKILHETRRGEMAALGEIPFGRYYGSVDSTPLFVLLAGEYFDRTGDLAFIKSIWKHLELAFEWIDHHGDQDGDGFVEYWRRSSKGLANQGWKDSQDAIFHEDGSLAEGPISLCEVQAYVYAAKKRAAGMAAALGLRDRAERFQREAEDLRVRFEEAFWCEDLSTYALALDGNKHPCRVRTSNPGHCLFTGIASPERARRVGDTLMDGSSFSGWGIRTVAAMEKRYNPMSYHNGSIWPHDNALIALGLSRCGMGHHALKVLGGMYDCARSFDLHRLPELFCGFPRRPAEGPIVYPVACSPQAWAAASVFLFLQATLGLTIEACAKRLVFTHPALPPFLKLIEIRGLRVGDAVVDVQIERHLPSVVINVLRKEGDVAILIVN